MDITSLEAQIEDDFFCEQAAPVIAHYRYLMTDAGFKFFREDEVSDDPKIIIGGYEKTIENIEQAIADIRSGKELEWDALLLMARKYGIDLQNNLSFHHQHPDSAKRVHAVFSCIEFDSDGTPCFDRYQHEIKKGSIKSFMESVVDFANSITLTAKNGKQFFTKEQFKQLTTTLSAKKSARHRP